MQTQAVKLYALPYNDLKTYVAAAAFIAGNLLLPQLFHLLPDGGRIWLPIYFFTLVSAYKYGWRTGLATAVISPLLNAWLFGMPAPEVLPGILLKSILLALTAGYTARKSRRASLGMLAAVVLTYQVLGTLGEWVLTGSLYAALQDFRMGVPGMLMQIAGGWTFIHYIIRK